MKIGYQGIKGAYSHIASTYLFPDAELIGYTSFDDAFEALNNQKVEKLVMPIENTIVGSINEVYDLIFKYKNWIKGEVTLKIDHNLLGTKSADIADLEKVYSHPKALGQCREFFKKNPNIEDVVYEDTAASAGYVSIKQDKTIGSIASLHAAKVYDLKVLESKVQTSDENYTRFIVVDRENGEVNGNKTSLLFSTTHEPGSLLAALQKFSDLNLTYIESRPLVDNAWKYIFYLDFEHSQSEDIDARIESMRPHTKFVRRLGTYPKGKMIAEELVNNEPKITKIQTQI